MMYNYIISSMNRNMFSEGEEDWWRPDYVQVLSGKENPCEQNNENLNSYRNMSIDSRGAYKKIGKHLIGIDLCFNGGYAEFERKWNNQLGFQDRVKFLIRCAEGD